MNPLQSAPEPRGSFASRLGELISEHRSANAFAKHVGITESLIRKYLSGGTPGLDKAVQIARAKNVRVEWLATGEGPRDTQPKDALTVMGTDREQTGRQLMQGTVPVESSEDAIALPRLTIDGSAGHGLIPTREEIEDYLSVSRRYLREVGINPHYAHVLRLSGHSMAPTLLDKDLVIVDTSQHRIRDEEIYALAYGDAVLIKRIRPQLDGGLKVISDNKGGHYEDTVVPASERGQVRIVGRVGGFLRYI